MSREGLREYIESGNYFKDAMKWYSDKYLLPINQKIWFFYSALILVVAITALIINVSKLLPIRQELRYAISISNTHETKAQIMDMNITDTGMTPYKFVANSLLKNYVTNRENYDYNLLDKQFSHIQNSSTRMVFKRFYNYMSINNPDSPVMRYQKYARRNVTITNVKFLSDTDAIVQFNSTSKDGGNNSFENLNWEAMISFQMGDVGMRLPTGSRFDFTVTDYKLKLLGEGK